MSTFQQRLARTAELSAEERLTTYAELAREADHPADVARAKVGELSAARNLRKAQHAVVVGAELIALSDELARMGQDEAVSTARRQVARRFNCAIVAALDLPEIPLATVDELIDVYDGMLGGLGLKPYSALYYRARRHAVAGDHGAMMAHIEELIPNVSRTNTVRHYMDCPGCILSGVVNLVGAEATVELAEEILEPIVSGRLTYRNEDPRLLTVLNDVFGGPRESCQPGLRGAFVGYTRSLVRAGRPADAGVQLRRADQHRSEYEWMLHEVAALEVALALGAQDRIAKGLERVLEVLEGEEDASEALLGSVVGSAAMHALGLPIPEREVLHARALGYARRLDLRIDSPRHVRDTLAELRDR